MHNKKHYTATAQCWFYWLAFRTQFKRGHSERYKQQTTRGQHLSTFLVHQARWRLWTWRRCSSASRAECRKVGSSNNNKNSCIVSYIIHISKLAPCQCDSNNRGESPPVQHAPQLTMQHTPKKKHTQKRARESATFTQSPPRVRATDTWCIIHYTILLYFVSYN